MSAEGGVQPKEYLAKYIAERVRNASGTWMGVTLGCAECHDHKFDPFTTKDFYQFEAFFADIKEQGLYSGAHETGIWGPSLKVPTPQQEADLAALDAKLKAVRETLAANTPELATAQAEWEKSQVTWTLLKPTRLPPRKVTLTLKDDGSYLASDKNPATDTYTLSFKSLPAGITALRLEVLPDDSLRKRTGPRGEWELCSVGNHATVKPASGDPRPVPLQNANCHVRTDRSRRGQSVRQVGVAAAIDADAKGKTWGWAVMEQVGKPHAAVFETAADLTLEEGATFQVELLQNLDNPHHTIGRFRISVATAARPIKATDLPPAIAAILAVPMDQRTEAQKTELANHYRNLAPLLEPKRKDWPNWSRPARRWMLRSRSR